MRIIKDTALHSNVNPLTINFLLEQEEYKPYARKILKLNNDPFIGRQIFSIDVVDKSEFDSLALKGANVVVRLVSDPDEKSTFAVATFDFSLPKKKLLPKLKEFIDDLYDTDLSLAQEVLRKYEGQSDEKGCETFSKLVELLKVAKPRKKNLNACACHTQSTGEVESDIPQSYKAPREDNVLYNYHPFGDMSDEDLRIRRAKNDLQAKMAKSQNFRRELNYLLKLLDDRFGGTSISKGVKSDEEKESSPETEETTPSSEEDIPESGEYLLQIVPYKYNLFNSTCDFYLQVNGIGKVLKVRTGLGAFIYAMCIILRTHNGVLRRETLLKEVPANVYEMSPEQKWMAALYDMLFSNNSGMDFRSWWKKQIGCDGPEYTGLTNAITQLKRKINDLIPNESVDYFTIHTEKDKADKRKVAYYWVDMPEENIIFEGSKFNVLIRNIPASFLEDPKEDIAE